MTCTVMVLNANLELNSELENEITSTVYLYSSML